MGGLWYVMGRGDSATPENATENGSVVSGVVIGVDMEGVAVDGPALVMIETEEGDVKTIAIPSMGILLCEASRIDDVFAVKAGDRVRVQGDITPDGYILPCEEEEHYFEVSAI